ncbi:MAG: response regulator transcription factor [Acidimicrobiales bacterium]
MATVPQVAETEVPTDFSPPTAESGAQRVLLIGNDDPILSALTEALLGAGYEVERATTELEALGQLKTWSPEVVLLDLTVQRNSGLAICRAVHERSGTPIILISPPGAADQLLFGLELGAADYVTRPLTLTGIVSKISRVTGVETHPSILVPDGEDLVSGPVTINTAIRTILVRGREVPFPRREYDLLLALAKHPRHIRSRGELMNDLWGHLSSDTKTIDVHVNRLRRKIEIDPQHPQHIISVRGVGYYFDPGTP